MKTFEYGDQEISRKELMFAVASMVIGVGVLTLPRLVADVTQASDGWISIAIAGMTAICLAWVSAKLAALFPNQCFFDYAAAIATKPVAIILTFLWFGYFLLFASYITRAIANIAKLYLLNQTPSEVIALIFMLVVIYAISGSRVGLLRLNLLFFPIVLAFAVLLLTFNTGLVELKNLKTFFVTHWTGIAKGVKESIFSLLGFEVILFYISYMNRPKQAPQAAIIGLVIPVILYLLVYLFVIGVFSVEATRNVVFPTIELAKETQLPGEFFERFESMFFLIWIMTIFNTACMAWDVSIMAASSLFRKVKKMTWIWILSPVIYITAMSPRDSLEFADLGTFISYFGLAMVGIVPVILFIIAKLRGVKGHL